MGRSLRRIKRYNTKLTKKKPRQAQRRAPTPIALKNQEPALDAKLDGQPVWDSLATYPANYANTGLVNDPNHAVGVRFADGVKPLFDPENPVEEVEEQDDDLRALLNKERLAGQAPPPKLTAHQQQVVQRLVDAHGEDVEAMAKDQKLNRMLLPVSKLQKLLLSYTYSKTHQGTKHRFRVPHKHNRFKSH